MPLAAGVQEDIPSPSFKSPVGILETRYAPPVFSALGVIPPTNGASTVFILGGVAPISCKSLGGGGGGALSCEGKKKTDSVSLEYKCT